MWLRKWKRPTRADLGRSGLGELDVEDSSSLASSSGVRSQRLAACAFREWVTDQLVGGKCARRVRPQRLVNGLRSDG